MAFRLGGSTRRIWGTDEDGDDAAPAPIGPLAIEQPLWPTLPVPHEVDRLFAQVFALVGEGIAGATHALLAGDREAAKELVKRDDVIDQIIGEISTSVQHQLVHGETTPDERRELVAILRMLPDMERNGDLAEHIARRAARGLGAEMSARSRGLVERMGEVATTIWRSTADAFAERSAAAANSIDALDDELDDLHVTLTAELVAGTMPLPVAIELAMVARFYERFGDHAVNLARRMSALVIGGPEPGSSGPTDPARPIPQGDSVGILPVREARDPHRIIACRRSMRWEDRPDADVGSRPRSRPPASRPAAPTGRRSGNDVSGTTGSGSDVDSKMSAVFKKSGAVPAVSVAVGEKSNMLARSNVVAGLVKRWSAEPGILGDSSPQLYSMKFGIEA